MPLLADAASDTPWWIYPMIPFFVLGGMALIAGCFGRKPMDR
jgi:hypothetical protein